MFINEYAPGTTTVSFVAQGLLDDKTPQNGQFEFELLKDDEVIETTANNEAGIVVFANEVFTQPGTYEYKIREIQGNDETIRYDSRTETIRIVVTDDGEGNLSVTDYEIPVFKNVTKPGVLEVTKETNEETDKQFTFEITLENEYGQSLDDVQIVREQ